MLSTPFSRCDQDVLSLVQELERQKKEQEDVERRQKELTERQQKQEEEGHQMTKCFGQRNVCGPVT